MCSYLPLTHLLIEQAKAISLLPYVEAPVGIGSGDPWAVDAVVNWTDGGYQLVSLEVATHVEACMFPLVWQLNIQNKENYVYHPTHNPFGWYKKGHKVAALFKATVQVFVFITLLIICQYMFWGGTYLRLGVQVAYRTSTRRTILRLKWPWVSRPGQFPSLGSTSISQ